MKVIDFHPDDLLDRELLGALSESEQRRLLEHLGQCHTCRLERQLRADFRVELAQPALEQALQSSVSGALRAALVQAPAGAPESAAGTRGSSRLSSARRRRALPALTAVAVVVASGVAAAQSGWGERVWQLAFGGAAAPQAQAAQRSPGSDGTRALDKGGARDEAAVPTATIAERPALVVAPSVAAAPLDPATESAQVDVEQETDATAARAEVAALKVASRIKRERMQARKAAQARAAKPNKQAPLEPSPSSSDPAPVDATNSRIVSSIASAPAPAVLVSNQAAAAEPELAPQSATAVTSPAPEAPIVNASTLFDQANSARRQGRIAEALSLYASLRERFITSPEARLSLALVARMRLDQGKPEAAVAGFEAYLATFDGALREQAMAGRALALGRLGLTSQEKAGWRDLLRAYPKSSYAELAERRLEGAVSTEPGGGRVR